VTAALRPGPLRRRRTRDPWRQARATVADRIENQRVGMVVVVFDVLTAEARFGERSARLVAGSVLDRFLAGLPEWPVAIG